MPLAGAELLTPIPDPEKIICIGLNYGSHAEETGRDAPDAPTIFGKFRNALAASGDVVTLPAASRKVDYEAEIAFVVGRGAKDVSSDQALDHIAGVVLFNDLSARDLQFQTPQWMAGKVFDGSAPCGPALVTLDETSPLDSVEFSLQLNGETMQSASTADLIFSIPALLAHLSNLMTLRPGDIVATGTPAGVGAGQNPPVFLKPGDVVELGIDGLGTARQEIRAFTTKN